MNQMATIVYIPHRELIDTNISKNNRRVWKMFSQICLGLNHLHQKGIIHRDINPKNILLDSNFQIKITGKKHAHYQFSNVFRHSFTQKVLSKVEFDRVIISISN